MMMLMRMNAMMMKALTHLNAWRGAGVVSQCEVICERGNLELREECLSASASQLQRESSIR